MDTIIFWLKALTHGVEHVLIVGRFRLQWQQCLRETAWTTAQLTDLLFQFNPTPRDLIASQRMEKKTHLNNNEDEASGDLPDAGHYADRGDSQASGDSKDHCH